MVRNLRPLKPIKQEKIPRDKLEDKLKSHLNKHPKQLHLLEKTKHTVWKWMREYWLNITLALSIPVLLGLMVSQVASGTPPPSETIAAQNNLMIMSALLVLATVWGMMVRVTKVYIPRGEKI